MITLTELAARLDGAIAAARGRSKLERDLDRALAERRVGRDRRKEAARKGWRTREGRA